MHVTHDATCLLPPVLLLHDHVGPRSTWSSPAPELAERFRALRLEFRGNSRSDRAPHDERRAVA